MSIAIHDGPRYPISELLKLEWRRDGVVFASGGTGKIFTITVSPGEQINQKTAQQLAEAVCVLPRIVAQLKECADLLRGEDIAHTSRGREAIEDAHYLLRSIGEEEACK